MMSAALAGSGGSPTRRQPRRADGCVALVIPAERERVSTSSTDVSWALAYSTGVGGLVLVILKGPVLLSLSPTLRDLSLNLGRELLTGSDQEEN